MILAQAVFGKMREKPAPGLWIALKIPENVLHQNHCRVDNDSEIHRRQIRQPQRPERQKCDHQAITVLTGAQS